MDIPLSRSTPRSRTLRLALAAVLVATTVTACGGRGSGADGDVQTIRFGSVGGLTDAGLYLAEARGYFADAGLRVERQRMGGGSEITTAVATGNLDVAGFAVTAGLFNAAAQGLDAKVVGDKQSVSTAASATRLVAQKPLVGGDVAASLNNLRGKRIAVSDPRSATIVLLDGLLKKYGMTRDDVRVETLAYPEMTAALINGSLDAAIELEPFLTTALNSGRVAEVSDLSEVVPADGATLVPLVYSQRFIDEQPEAAQGFMTAYLRGVRDYNDAFLKDQSKQEVAEIIAEAAQQPLEVVLAAHVAGLDPDQVVSRQFLEDTQQWFVESGLVNEPVDISTLLDDRFAKEAVNELGSY
ncbi:ABC transporter substrate-binding protein [Micromonospora sp. WMMD1082]|uniref:ABC transporter substrate-binding protein n=1 Tax=Micromonospora sp. WMMD1082 TaxID=3016104 RepID=UPI002416DE95|nr:ABC transporter substrate-binding protein [Micromonospora sp. WMMD1082]MDG4798343.1 ABC transporter substrate-binding protein [Micromonospora sp. WMMD1082]